MKKIYLSPANHTTDNKYASGVSTENTECNKITGMIKVNLERCGFQVKMAPKGQNMNASIKDSNSYKPDLHIALHTNAGGGKGTEVMVYDKASANMKFATPIFNNLAPSTPSGFLGRGIKTRPDLAELRQTSSIAVYIEVDFHDNFDYAKWIADNTGLIAEKVTIGICQGFGVNYVAEPVVTQPGEIYRVQVGAFANKANADKLVTELKSKGYSAIIV